MRNQRLHFKHRDFDGLLEVVNLDTAPSSSLELALLKLSAGNVAERVDEGRESVLMILTGICSISVEGMRSWEELGGRESVFSGRATAVYIPSGVPYQITAQTNLELAICRAPAQGGCDAFVVRPADVGVRVVGEASWRREVHDVVDESRPAARLMVGETFNQPGAWSSYPPHKHDVQDPPVEVQLEEIYHYRLQPAGGFGLQRIYSPERSFDQTFAVENGDTVLIPFGYHPVVAAPGYRLYYLWALAGEGRTLRPHEDPAHQWVGRQQRN